MTFNKKSWEYQSHDSNILLLTSNTKRCYKEFPSVTSRDREKISCYFLFFFSFLSLLLRTIDLSAFLYIKSLIPAQ